MTLNLKKKVAEAFPVLSRINRKNNRNITGIITDSEGKPLDEVNVLAFAEDEIKDGTITDKDGRFELLCLSKVSNFKLKLIKLGYQNMLVLEFADNETVGKPLTIVLDKI